MSERRPNPVSITTRLERHGPYLIAAGLAGWVAAVEVNGNTLAPEPGRSIAPRARGSGS